MRNQLLAAVAMEINDLAAVVGQSEVGSGQIQVGNQCATRGLWRSHAAQGDVLILHNIHYAQLQIRRANPSSQLELRVAPQDLDLPQLHTRP